MTLRLLDEEMYQRVVAVVEISRRKGLNLPEQLFQADLLWTPARERQYRAQTLKFLATEMTQWTPPEFLRTVNKTLAGATPAEMYWAVHGWIKKHAEHAATHDP